MAVKRVREGAKVVSYAPKGNDDPTPDWLLVSMLKAISGEQRHFGRLRKYVEGDPPKPDTPNSVNDEWEEFEQFRQKARTNYAELIIGACLDRTIITGFRTAAANDEDGDLEAERLWDENDMDVRSDRTHSDIFTYGRGSLLANPFTKRAQDFRPWQYHLINDMAGQPVAAVTLEHNPLQARDYAYLWMREVDDFGIATGPVVCHIAVRDRENKVGQGGQFKTEVPLGTYLPQRWVWWKTEVTTLERLPVVEFQNREAVGEFERHTDVLDRINHMLLQRVVIATMQAFKQRALKGEFPEFDKQGNKIDYDKLFPSSPGAMWLIPPESEMWESGQTSIQEILASVKDDVRDLAAVTRTPMTYFSPDAANGSAEGASLQREGYTSKVDDRKARMAGRWRAFMSLMFEINGDTVRSDITKLEILWTPTEVLSLAERYSSGAQAKGLGLPLKTVMREVLHYTPKQMRAAELERISEALTAVASTPTVAAGSQPGGGDAPSLTPLQRSAQARQALASSNGANSRSTGATSGRAGQ
ncbi:portal protein [Rhodococcus phage Apiary]|nr:portal protein [Rhodococcus phage Maselop]WNM69837.1 portal protein [Rhodococcus phage Apiary]